MACVVCKLGDDCGPMQRTDCCDQPFHWNSSCARARHPAAHWHLLPELRRQVGKRAHERFEALEALERLDELADPRAAHGGPKTQQELAALWLQMLQMPPPQLAQCLMVHTLTAPEGHPFPMRPAVRVVLPGIPKYADFTDVLLGILTLLVSSVAPQPSQGAWQA